MKSTLTWKKAFIIWLSTGVVTCAITTCISTLAITKPWEKKLSLLPAQTTPPATSDALVNVTPTAFLSPTPEPPRPQPTPRVDTEEYIVQTNDTLAIIAMRFGLGLNELMSINGITDPDVLYTGQVLLIPPTNNQVSGSDFKIIPDSELVSSISNMAFDTAAFISQKHAYLYSYREEVDGIPCSGTQIVNRVAREYSVNPRLLLAVLEYQSGWVTQTHPAEDSLKFPMKRFDSWREGLYRQLSWAADTLNHGFYLWRVNGAFTWTLADGNAVPIAPTINAGTAGVQYLMSQLYAQQYWAITVSETGVFNTYLTFFGYPFDLAFEPLIPAGLTQPAFQLPFETGQSWSFTGGPHGGWGNGSAWAALDFAPPGEPQGCIVSDAWVTAVVDGLVVRSENGAVVQDLDNDGWEQTGWTVLYLHVDTFERVANNTFLKAGEHIGHPSCEGGFANGAHIHIARRYNGEWIPADGSLPFILDGWVSEGTGILYDGFLRRNGQTVEAWDSYKPENQIQR